MKSNPEACREQSSCYPLTAPAYCRGKGESVTVASRAPRRSRQEGVRRRACWPTGPGRGEEISHFWRFQ